MDALHTFTLTSIKHGQTRTYTIPVNFQPLTKGQVHQIMAENDGKFVVSYPADGKTYLVNETSAGQTNISELSPETIASLREKYAAEPFTVETFMDFLCETSDLRLGNGKAAAMFIWGYDGHTTKPHTGYSPMFGGVENYTTVNEWIRHFEMREEWFPNNPNHWVSDPFIAELTKTEMTDRAASFVELLGLLREGNAV